MDDIANVKQKTDIVSIIGEHVILKKAGRHFKGLCPFHNEKSPSFIVSPELQIFKCFGCGESGDVFTFLEKYEGMEFYEALTTLAKKAGITLTNKSNYQKSDKEYLYEINSLAAKFYNYVLTKHPLGKYALNYLLEERGINLSTIEEFNIGYSPDSQALFSNFFITKKKISANDLEKAGIVYMRGNAPIDRFRGRVIFPLTDSRGNVCGFAGRITPKDKNLDLAKYINTPETSIYHKSELLFGINLSKKAIKKQQTAIIVEGELDMISSYQAGLKNVVAIKGSALTTEQARVLSRLCSKVVLALDSDFAGDAAAKRGINVLSEFGFEIMVASFGKYKDPDEVARSDRQALFEGIDNAIPIWDFMINSIFKKYIGTDGAAKSHISREVVSVLSSISDLILRSHYVNLVAGKLGVSSDAVNAQVENYVQKNTSTDTNTNVPVSKSVEFSDESQNDTYEEWEERLFSLVISYDLPKLTTYYEEGVFTNTVIKKIIEHYNKHSHEITYAKLVDILPPELSDRARDLAMTRLPDSLEETKKEASELSKRIKKHNLNEEKEAILSQIRQIEVSENASDDELLVLQKKFNDVAKKLTQLEVDK